jgi:hypothetical protein
LQCPFRKKVEMRRYAVLLLSSALALSAADCATGPTARPPTPQDYFYRATPERVWNALLLVYTDLNIPIANMDKSSWFMRSQDVSAAGDTAWLDCGYDWKGDPTAAAASVSLTVTTLLRQSGDSTAMRLNVHLGSGLTGASGCVSKGVLEKRVVELVRQRL